MQGNNQAGNGQKQSGSGSPLQSGLSWTQPATGSAPSTSTSTKPAASPVPAQKSGQPKPPASRPPASSSSRTMGYFLGGIVVAGLIVWGLYAMRSGTDTAGVTASSTASSTAPKTATNGAKVSNVTTTKPGAVTAGTINIPASAQFGADTQKAGTQVTVTNVRVPKASWLVVYESVNGGPGNALGAAMAFPENNGKSVVVPLLRATLPAHTYLIGVSIDNGDHVFSTQSDEKFLDTGGKLIVTPFQTN